MVLVVTHLVVEGEHVQILSGDLEAFQTHAESSFFQNSCPGLHAVDRSELSSTTTAITALKRGGTDGFTCCVRAWMLTEKISH